MPLPVPVSNFAPAPVARTRPRTAILASADASFRQRLSQRLTGLRWQVREAATGAQAWTEAEAAPPEAVIVDSWLPDLDLSEFLREFRRSFPRVDVLTSEGGEAGGPRSSYRQELLYALRTTQDTDTAAWNTACDLEDARPIQVFDETKKPPPRCTPSPKPRLPPGFPMLSRPSRAPCSLQRFRPSRRAVKRLP